MKKLIKPVRDNSRTVLAYDNENCHGANCSAGCGGSSSGGGAGGAIIGAIGTIIGACIGAICT